MINFPYKTQIYIFQNLHFSVTGQNVQESDSHWNQNNAAAHIGYNASRQLINNTDPKGKGPAPGMSDFM
jgi:hypothetical protein